MDYFIVKEFFIVFVIDNSFIEIGKFFLFLDIFEEICKKVLVFILIGI